MKTIKFLILTIAIVSMSFKTADTSLTPAERKYAIDLLQETRDDLLLKIKGLTTAQLNFKPDSLTWSIAECVEHIAISENDIFGFVKTSLKEQANPAKRSELKYTDEAVVKMITDRSTKVKTREAFKPTGKFGSFDATLNAFKSTRDSNIKYVKTTSDDLRNHYYDFRFGTVDTYQAILFIAGHCKRHTEQIEEVMKNPAFSTKGK